MKKRVLIAGVNGYIGTALYTHLSNLGHVVIGFDNNSREFNVRSVGGRSITEKKDIFYKEIDACDYDALKKFVEEFRPDTIIWLAEQPSAPFSMRNADSATSTQYNNVIGTLNILWIMREVCPDAHLIKLGTEGEYAADVWDGKVIPEGATIEVKYQKEDWKIPVPRYGGSFYHFSKIFDDYNIDYACKIWGLSCTNIQQGVVYGYRNGTRLDVDESFGTAINRFIAQAVAAIPLTVYGTGEQVRGFINLQNSLEAITLLTENPANKGEFRVIHQSTEALQIKQIAEEIQKRIDCTINFVENPRVEKQGNTFTFDTSTLDDLGLVKIPFVDEIDNLIKVVQENKDNIPLNAINPKTKWK